MAQQPICLKRMILGGFDKHIHCKVVCIETHQTLKFFLNFFDRMIVCAKQTLEDFGVIVHEMGHIQYFMACKDQPTVFQVRSRNYLGLSFYWNSFSVELTNRMRFVTNR